MQAGPPPSGGCSGLQGRSAGPDAQEVSHSDPEGGGACLGPSPRGPQSRTARTHGLQLAQQAWLRGKQNPRSTLEARHGGALQAAGEPPGPQLHAAPGVRIRWDAAPRQPHMAGGGGGSLGTLLRRPGPRTQTGHAAREQDNTRCREQSGGTLPRGCRSMHSASNTALQVCPGGTSLNPQGTRNSPEGSGLTALSAGQTTTQRLRGPETPTAPEAQTRGTWV